MVRDSKNSNCGVAGCNWEWLPTGSLLKGPYTLIKAVDDGNLRMLFLHFFKVRIWADIEHLLIPTHRRASGASTQQSLLVPAKKSINMNALPAQEMTQPAWLPVWWGGKQSQHGPHFLFNDKYYRNCAKCDIFFQTLFQAKCVAGIVSVTSVSWSELKQTDYQRAGPMKHQRPPMKNKEARDNEWEIPAHILNPKAEH